MSSTPGTEWDGRPPVQDSRNPLPRWSPSRQPRPTSPRTVPSSNSEPRSSGSKFRVETDIVDGIYATTRFINCSRFSLIIPRIGVEG